MNYENLLLDAEKEAVDVYERNLKSTIKGLYSDKIIWINKKQTRIEKGCVLAEELGHYHTSSGNILDQSSLVNKKQELAARRWAYTRLVPLYKIVQANKAGIRNRYELAQFLNVTEDFLEDALKRYKDKYGAFTIYKNYTIYFEPLAVLEMFN